MIKRAVKWLFILLLAVMMYAYAMFQGGFVSWFLFYSVMPLFIYAFIIAIFPLRNIQIERTFSSDLLQAGQPLEVTLHIRKSYFPLFYVIIEDCMTSRLKKHVTAQEGTKALFFPFFKRNMHYTYHIPSLPRGDHLFTNVTIKTGDLFGFVEKKITIKKKQPLFVFPKVQKIDWKLASQGFSGTSNSFMRRTKNEASVVVGVRDYVAGDRMSWLDWKATAKRNKLLTKQFEQHASDRVVLFLDDSQESYKKNEEDLFEEAVSLSASLVAAAIRNGNSVVLPSLAELEQSHIRVVGHRDYERQLYYLLGKVEANRQMSFAEHVRQAAVHYSKGYNYVFITTKISDELVMQCKQFVFKNIQVDVFFIAHAKAGKERQIIESSVNKMKALGVNVYVIWHEEPKRRKEAGDKGEAIKK
ncbi:hypothetical protein DCC39_16915 [Pueribacillus theae]|uniref:DUF58 domain-containing protein n=1 Tax=Pueribacillus theae TaxID=2171751 RepID=A0A2U1JPZ0_9BACI|nr:DUF58 domain-containing protein [Pueribacillus theae]PWA07044.1 hypothetical protein DCC39_16915 [Pueribacillus theae]